MKLTTVHQILIAGAIGMGVLFAVRSIYLWITVGGARHPATAAGGLILAGVAAYYLRRFRGKLKGHEG